MLSVLVGHTYFLGFDRKQQERARPYPPLATLQVAERIRRGGHEVALFDAMLAQGPAEFATVLTERRPELVVLYEDNYNFLTKMCLARMREAALEMIAMARAAGARVIVAGSDVSDAPGPYLAAGADAALRGEGLDTLHTLLARLDADRAADLSTPAEEKVVSLHRTESHTLEAPAAWDLVDVPRYRRIWQRAHGFFSLNMAASKGCSFRCAWCAKPIWGSRYQQRSPEAVAAEMMALKADHAPDHIWFADDIFGFRADWVERFAAALEAGGGGVPFTIQTRADLSSEAMVAALARAGCRQAWIGAESGSQRVLDAMQKGTTVEQIHAARGLMRKHGIRVGFFIQLGYLGEGLEELLCTRELIEQARPDEIGVSVSYPLPGTRFHEQVREQLGPKTHWDESGDLAMMFDGAFGTEFYRRVRDLLHEQVEGERPGLADRWDHLIKSLDRPRLQAARAGT
ncbi:MAG: B12-binding domain-containing radical SAM protein [Paucibacter sp.]|nr:B12-binding domain-containing radical SAM protein [Roseateles sp.]